MPAKVQHGGRLRRLVRLAAALAPLLAAAPAVPRAADVRGRLTLLDKGNRPAEDVGQAVVWLEGASGPPAPVQAEITTADKSFTPHVLVVPVGSTVSFPNHDPFNHNVFSLSEEQPFDLGLYGRGETRSVRVTRPGIIRVYCNVHAQMSALLVVRDGPYVTQPSGDGSFDLGGVPPGNYILHAWHERAAEVTRAIDVPAAGLDALSLTLDASGYRFKPHLNKFGQPYPQQGRRY
jgi:plastocyanin